MCAPVVCFKHAIWLIPPETSGTSSNSELLVNARHSASADFLSLSSCIPSTPYVAGQLQNSAALRTVSSGVRA